MDEKGWTMLQWGSFAVAILFIVMALTMTGEIQGESLVLVRPTPWMYVLFGLSMIGYYFFVLAQICKRRNAERITLRLAGQAFFWTGLFYVALYVINEI